MKILSRYMMTTVINTTATVLLALIGMQLFIQFAAELQDIGMKQYGLWQALIYVPLTLPSNVYQFFPMAALIGTLMGLGRLASRSELIVMRSAGVSQSQITWSIIKAAILMLIVVTVLGEWLAPYSNHFANQYKRAAMSGNEAVTMRHDLWLRDGNNYLHIGRISSDNTLHNITRYQFNTKQQLMSASHAQLGQYVNKQWQFKQVKQSIFKPKQVIMRHAAVENWPVSINPQLEGLNALQTDELTLWGLYNDIHYRLRSGLSSGQYQFAFWQRIIQPLSTIVMICLAIPFIFGPLRSVSMGLRILTGVLFGFTFYILNAFFGPISMVYHIPPLLAAATPTLLFTGVGVWLLIKSR